MCSVTATHDAEGTTPDRTPFDADVEMALELLAQVREVLRLDTERDRAAEEYHAADRRLGAAHAACSDARRVLAELQAKVLP